MPDQNFHEKRFYDALRDIFVGVKVEGQSGFINLMQIKSRYYTQGVFPRLHKDVEQALAPFPNFREELFDKLYTFFQRYFSESGSIYFHYTPLHQNIYEKVYTDERDVVLFWKTHMLYYVKTDRIFNSLSVELDGLKYVFDASQVEHKRANEKREVVFSLREVRPDQTLDFQVSYSERGSKTKEDEILRQARQAGVALDAEKLSQALRTFEKQSEVDYFINKNARAFLQEQFELWMYQYLFAGQNVWTAERLAQLQSLKEIAFKVIDFISQFEDELVRVWNKPKFVRNSHYILTLDHLLADADLAQRLFAHPGMAAQLQEWRELGMLETQEVPDAPALWELLQAKDLLGAPLQPHWQYLPVDTRHFPDLELDILALFDDLDASLDGWLVHSENYQALNTLLPKFKNLIDCIFIDPPYNTGSDDFLYNDNFKSASWLTMIFDRLSLARNWLNGDDGSLYITIDENEVSQLKMMTENIFGSENFIATVIWQKVFAPKNTAKYFSYDHDYILTFAKNKSKWSPYLLERSSEADARYSNSDNDPRGDWASRDLTARNYYSEGLYEVTSPSGKKFNPTIGTYWRVSKENFDRLNKEKRIWWGTEGNDMPRLKRFLSEVKSGVVPQTLWKHEDVGNTQEAKKELLATTSFARSEDVLNTVKPTRLIQRIIEISTDVDKPSIILDFFAGGGSTAHAVMSYNRKKNGNVKYLLMEMGDHFNTIILPRIKKIAFHSKWKDGKPVFAAGESGMSHFVKYYALEQYEETLQRARYADADLFDDPNQDPYHAYVFLRDLKLLDSLEIDHPNQTVRFHPERLYPDASAPFGTSIDLAESLSHLRGKWIKRIRADEVEFQDGETLSLSNPDWRLFKPMIWWA